MFLIYSEGLSLLLRLARQEGRLSGVKASKGGPMISHLFFADDCILFGEASLQMVRSMKHILREYEENSGQCVNFDKSSVFFSTNIIENLYRMLAMMLGVRHSKNPEKHLGLLNVVGRNKKASFIGLKDGMQKKVDGWYVRFLSQEDKKVLSSHSIICYDLLSFPSYIL